jgi:hypothetical protein
MRRTQKATQVGKGNVWLNRLTVLSVWMVFKGVFISSPLTQILNNTSGDGMLMDFPGMLTRWVLGLVWFAVCMCVWCWSFPRWEGKRNQRGLRPPAVGSTVTCQSDMGSQTREDHVLHAAPRAPQPWTDLQVDSGLHRAPAGGPAVLLRGCDLLVLHPPAEAGQSKAVSATVSFSVSLLPLGLLLLESFPVDNC